MSDTFYWVILSVELLCLCLGCFQCYKKLKGEKKMNRIDEKLEKLGFKKIQDDEYGVYYERYNATYDYT